MKKIAIVLDSGSNFENNNPDIYVLPMQIFIKDNQNIETNYLDNADFNRELLINSLKDKNFHVGTSMASPGSLLNLIDELHEQYDHIVILPLSKYLSSFYDNCKSLTQNYSNVHVINGNCVGISGNWIAQRIIDYINDNGDINELQKFVDEIIQKTCGVVIVGDLTQLKKGGRINSFKCLIASALKLKLIVKFDGQLNYVAKDLNWKGAIEKSLKIIDEQINYSQNSIAHISIMNELNNVEEGNKLTEYTLSLIQQQCNNEASLLPKCVIAHTGNNSFSILIQTK